MTTEDGRAMHPVTLSGLFVRQARRAGLPQIRRHDLRHLVASILLARASTPSGSASLPGQAAVVRCGLVRGSSGTSGQPNVKVPENTSVRVGIRVPLCRLVLPQVDEHGQGRDEGF